ncbi:proteoliaisin-like, partial [Planoprotostelium fungivorum]
MKWRALSQLPGSIVSVLAMFEVRNLEQPQSRRTSHAEVFVFYSRGSITKISSEKDRRVWTAPFTVKKSEEHENGDTGLRLSVGHFLESSKMRRVLLLASLFALVQSQCTFVDQKNLTQAAAGVNEVRLALPPMLSQYLSQNDFEITYQRAETEAITFELNLLEGFGRYTISSSVISNGVVQLSVANVGSITATESTFALVVSLSSGLRPNGFVSLALVILLAALRTERKLALFLILSLVLSVQVSQAKDVCQSHANIILPLSVQTLCVDGNCLNLIDTTTFFNSGDLHGFLFEHFQGSIFNYSCNFIHFGRDACNIAFGCHIICIFGIINYLYIHICYYICCHLCSHFIDCLCGHSIVIINCFFSTWSSTISVTDPSTSSSTFSPSTTISAFINCTEGTVLVDGSCIYIDVCGVPGGDNSTCNRFSLADFCGATAPYRCPDGSCSSSLSLCVVLCPPEQVRCCDGSCGNTTRDCVQSSYSYLTVQDDTIITCPDGLCQSDPNSCLCNDALYKCYDGSCQIDCPIVPVSLMDLKVTTDGGTYAMLRSDTLAPGAQVSVSNSAGNISIVATTITPADEAIGKRLIGINLISPIVRIQGYASDHSYLFSFPSPISFNFSNVTTATDGATCHALLTSEGTFECLDNKTKTFSLSGPSIVTTISGVYGSRGICWYRDACGVCNGVGACNLPYGNICLDGSYCSSGICIITNATINATNIVDSSNSTTDSTVTVGTCGCDASSCPAGYQCDNTSTCQCVVDRCGVCGGLDDCYAKGGEACTVSTDCASGICQSSRCSCDNIHGCTTDQSCHNNTCICDGELDKCGVCNGNGTTCGRPMGADCSKDANCFSGLCLRGVCSCSDSSQCPDPQICSINATCICYNSTVDNCGVCG